MKIKQTIEKVPGGLMLVPMLLGALCKTFTPWAGDYFGGFTKGLITGTVPILAVWFFCMGAGINIKATATVLRKSGTIVVTKILTAWAVGFLCVHILMPESGMIETGFLAGLSTLSIVAAMDMTNGGLYAALMSQYGTKEEAGAFVLTSIESGPLVTMLILGSTGAAYFEPQLFIGAVLPFILGFILGNLDPELREFFGKASMTMIPFFGFALGNGINLKVIMETGMLGVLLGLTVIVITGIPLILADRWIGGGHGGAGVAASSTAGAAAANPAIIGEMLKGVDTPAAQYIVASAPKATALVATSVLVTSIVVPIITAYWCRYFNKTSEAHIAEGKHTL